MPRFNDPRHESTEERDLLIPSTALCLRLRRRGQDELVVHRDEVAAEDFVFLFEALDDAHDYALMAREALGVFPQIIRVNLRGLHFRTARFKPAVGEPLDLPLRG
ncbi:hypothetical protein [Armatimonas rosea]|uniref:Uncharacterized protein n=1 Tax=Armatimonas rosea TaxID=685828 RepID=A0A7W9SRE1_ARMRO|nr:hypothetical protein [Armatimonas rosea]MBB6050653.1 hypothetical protein [Armatimonas rosea]